MRLIDADALIKKLEGKEEEEYYGWVFNYGDVFDAIDELSTVEQSRWIPCSERLPEKWGDYLVTSKWKGVGSGTVYIETNMAVYNKRAKKWDHPDVIAWQPLPQPYTESEDK